MSFETLAASVQQLHLSSCCKMRALIDLQHDLLLLFFSKPSTLMRRITSHRGLLLLG